MERDQAAAAAGSNAGEHSSSLAPTPASALQQLLADGPAPGYRRFYGPELVAKARRIYRSDLRFLDRSRQRGILGSELHARLSAL